MTPWAGRAVMALLFMVSVHLKVRHSLQLPRYDPQDETGYFKVESAFQYRYARMVSRGERLPEFDVDAQHPEGVRVEAELTTLMMRLTGWSYRLWPFSGPRDFRLFVILWVAVVSSLSVPAFYGLAARFSKDAFVALAGTALYAVSWPSLSDLIGSYAFPTLALPLIFGSLHFFCAAADPENPRPAANAGAAGLLMALALASWHVTRFYLAAFNLAAILVWWCRRRAGVERLRIVLGIQMACLTVAALAFTTLRETSLLLSPGLWLGAAALAATWGGPRPLLAVILVGAGIQAAPWRSGVEETAYGHVWSLLYAKLRFLLVKPDDPSRLDPDARLLWVGPFNSPEAGFLLFSFLPLGLATLPRLADMLRRSPDSRPGAGGAIVDVMTLLSLAGTAMISRLTPVFAFFLGLSSLRATPRRWLAAALLALAVLEGFKSYAPASRLNPFMRLSAPFSGPQRRPVTLLSAEREVLSWLRERGGGKPVLAHFGFSGPILAYAGTPTLLNPKFESASSRRKSLAFMDALYKDEETFHRFCADNGAAYFIYHTGYILDETGDGPRYAAAAMRLSPDAAAVRFHFQPEALKRFRLRYQNEDFRIYATDLSAPSAKVPPSPVYDLAQFGPGTEPDGTLRLDVSGALARMSEHRRELFKARLLARLGQNEAALDAYERAFKAWPPDEKLRRETARLQGARVGIDDRRR